MKTLIFVAAVLFMSTNVAAAEPPSPSYGTTSLSWITLSRGDFHPLTGSTMIASGSGWQFAPGDGTSVLVAPIHVPAGADIVKIAIDDCHQVAGGLVVELWSYGPADGVETDTFMGAQSNSGSPQCSQTEFNWGVLSIDNKRYIYEVKVRFFDYIYDSLDFVSAIRIGYRLKVSPPPATASFTDVPTSSPYFPFVEALRAAGITAGCSATQFCPNSPVTRAQMATLLATALGLHWGDQ